MLPIPRFNYRNSVSTIPALVCDLSATYPASVATPTIWYKADVATSSTDTNFKNTVNSSSRFSRLYDFGSRFYGAVHLNKELVANSFPSYDATKTQNGGTIIAFPADGSARWILNNTGSGTIGLAGKGTIIVAFKTGYSTGAGYPADYAGNLCFQARNPNSQAYGFRMETSNRATIFGDNQSYTFTTMPSTNYVRIVSVASIGNPTYVKQNGVSGLTASYDTMSNQGTLLNVSLEQTGSLNVDYAAWYEAMFYETPLTSDECISVENYLKQKWCISY